MAEISFVRRILIYLLVLASLTVVQLGATARPRGARDASRFARPATASRDSGGETAQAPSLVDRFGRSVPGEVLVKLRTESDVDRVLAFTATGSARSDASGTLMLLLAEFKVTAIRRLLAAAPARLASARIGRLAELGRVITVCSATVRAEPGRLGDLLARLNHCPEVEYARPNLIYEAQTTPNDRYYDSLGAWGQAFPDLWGLGAIEVERAWDVSSGYGIVVAVVDSGIDYTHKDIAKNVWTNPGEMGTDPSGRDHKSNGIDDDGNGYVDDWRGWDFVAGDGTGDNDPMDDNGHGTHVAGTIAAVGNNRVGIIGVAPNAHVMALKGIDREGLGTSEGLASAIVYAAQNGARVINASWTGLNWNIDEILAEAIDFAHDERGAVVVAAAGNASTDVEFYEGAGFGFASWTLPAALPNVIAVAAVTHELLPAAFSNYGAKIDVAAPGGGDPVDAAYAPQQRTILSLRSSKASHRAITDLRASTVGRRYLRLSGTSMANPHVAGVAALILSRDPSLTPEQVRQAMRRGARDLGDPGFDVGFGFGMLDAAGAVASTPLSAPYIDNIAERAPDGLGLRIDASIDGEMALSWALEYGRGETPAEWSGVAVGPGGYGSISANWDTDGVPDGLYYVRLRATGPDGVETEFRRRLDLAGGRLAPDWTWFSLSSSEYFSELAGGRLIVKSGLVAMVQTVLKFPFVKATRYELFEGDRFVGTFEDAGILGASFVWTPGLSGRTSLRVDAVDENGVRHPVGPFAVDVADDLPPQIYQERLVYTSFQPLDLYIAVSAIDPESAQDGLTPDGVTVDFYADARLLGAGRWNESYKFFEFTWRDIAAGTYRLRAVAADRNGNSSEWHRDIRLEPPSTARRVITGPSRAVFPFGSLMSIELKSRHAAEGAASDCPSVRVHANLLRLKNWCG